MSDLFSSLKTELQKQQKCLQDVDVNLKRLTGRDFHEPRGERRPRIVSAFHELKEDEPPAKRKFPGVFARLGAPVLENRRQNDEMPNRSQGRSVYEVRPDNFVVSKRRPFLQSTAPKPYPEVRTRTEAFTELSMNKDSSKDTPIVQSSVSRPISLPDGKTRNEALAELTKDTKINARNRRMFSCMNGVLAQFKNDEVKQKDRDQRRASIDKKLEERGHAEKEEMKREKADLIIQKRSTQASIKELEYKMTRVTEHNEWERHQRKLKYFIKTAVKPPIFWMPKLKSSRSIQSLIRATGDSIENEIKEEKGRLKKLMDRMFPEKSNDEALDRNRSSFEDQQKDSDKFNNGSKDDKEEGGLTRELDMVRLPVKWEDSKRDHGLTDSFSNRSNILDYNAEDGQLLIEESEPWLPGKKCKNAERMVVQVDSVSEASTRRVAMVTVVVNRTNDMRKRTIEENGSDKEPKRRKESDYEKKSKERLNESINKSLSEEEMNDERQRDTSSIDLDSAHIDSHSGNKKSSHSHNGTREKSKLSKEEKAKSHDVSEDGFAKKNKFDQSSHVDIKDERKENISPQKEITVAMPKKKTYGLQEQTAIQYDEMNVSPEREKVSLFQKVTDEVGLNENDNVRKEKDVSRKGKDASRKESDKLSKSKQVIPEEKNRHLKEKSASRSEREAQRKDKDASRREREPSRKEKDSSHREKRNRKDDSSKKDRSRESKSNENQDEAEEVWSEDLSHISLPLGPAVTELVVQHGDEMEAILIPTSQIKKDKSVRDVKDNYSPMTIKKEKRVSPLSENKNQDGKKKNPDLSSEDDDSSSDSDEEATSEDSSDASSSDSDDAAKKKVNPRHSKKKEESSSESSSSSSSSESSSDSESSSENEMAKKKESKSPRREENYRQKVRERNSHTRRSVGNDRRTSRERRSRDEKTGGKDRRSSRDRKRSKSKDRRRERR